MSIHAYYATLARAKRELKASTDADDMILLELIGDASARLDDVMALPYRQAAWTPTHDTRQVPVTARTVNRRDNTLSLRAVGPLLAITSVTLAGATVTSSVEAFPTDRSPIRALRYTARTGSWYDAYRNQSTPSPAFATVTGVWGLSRDYADAWTDVTTLAADVSASATTLTVADGSALSAGHLLRIGDEFLTATDVSATTVTVRRGVNGTVAAAHTAEDAVATWAVDRTIARAVARQAGMMYARRGAYEVRSTDGVGGDVVFPRDLLHEVRQVLTAYQYV